MKINWEAVGVVVAIISVIALPLFHQLYLSFEKHLKETVSSYVTFFFEEKIEEARKSIRQDISEIFEQYYYPLDSQIKHCRENITKTQQQLLQLNRINEVKIEKLSQKLKETINNED